MKINSILIQEKDVQPEILNYEASKWKEGTFEQFKLIRIIIRFIDKRKSETSSRRNRFI